MIQQQTPELLSALSIATELLHGIDHRVYYTCVKTQTQTQTQTQPWNCIRGKEYLIDNPSKKFEHVCVFAGKPGKTPNETCKNLDAHFETKFPNHKVVQTLFDPK